MRSVFFNRCLAWLLCLALMIKVIVPVGFMPDLNALSRGTIKITICHGYGSKQITLDQNLKPIGNSNHGKKSGNDFCPFGAAPHAAIIPFLVVFSIIFIAVIRRTIFAEDQIDIFNLCAAQPRGPPQLLN